MNYYLRKPGTHEFSGPFTLAEIRKEVVAERATRQWEAMEANGQSYHHLVQATGWVSIHALIGECNPSAPDPSSSNAKSSAKKSALARCAIWSGAATFGVPLLWVMLGSTLGGNAGLAVGWYGVLPVLLGVPIGIIVTLCLTIAAVVNQRKDKTKAALAATNDPNERNAMHGSDPGQSVQVASTASNAPGH